MCKYVRVVAAAQFVIWNMGLCASSSGTKASDSVHPEENVKGLKANFDSASPKDKVKDKIQREKEEEHEAVVINLSSEDEKEEAFPTAPTHTKSGKLRTKYHSQGDAPTSSDDSSEYDRHDVAVSEAAESSVLSMPLYSVVSSSKGSSESADKDETFTIILDSVAAPMKENKIKRLTEKQKMEKELLLIFNALDDSKDGYLQVREFRRALIRRPDLGAYVRPRDVRLAFALLGLPEGKAMDFAMFRRFCMDTKEKHTSAMESRKTLQWITNLRSLFFRLGAGRDGRLSLKRLRRGLLLSPSLGHMLRANEIDESLGKLGLPLDGTIAFHDFKTYCLHLATIKNKPWAAKALQIVTLLKSMFISLDTNKNGTLEVRELKRMMEKRPDIVRFIRPVELRKTLKAMEVPSRGQVKYDQFETGVLLASGGVPPEPEILVDLDAASIQSGDSGGSLTSSSGSSDSDSLNGSASPEEDGGNYSDDSLDNYIWGKDVDDSISINFTAIARSRARSRRSSKSHAKRRATVNEWAGQRNAHMQLESSEEDSNAGDDESEFSFEGSATGRSRWSMQSHRDDDELYEHNHPDLMVIGSSSEDEGGSSIEGFEKHGDIENAQPHDSEDDAQQEDVEVVESDEEKEEKVMQRVQKSRLARSNKQAKVRVAIHADHVLQAVSFEELNEEHEEIDESMKDIDLPKEDEKQEQKPEQVSIPFQSNEKQEQVSISSESNEKQEQVPVPSESNEKQEHVSVPSESNEKQEQVSIPSESNEKQEHVSVPSESNEKQEHVSVPSESNEKQENVSVPSESNEKQEQVLPTPNTSAEDDSQNDEENKKKK